MGQCHNIPAGANGCSALAGWIHSQFSVTAPPLLFVPNRRMARQLREALAAIAPERATLLPPMLVLGGLVRTDLLQLFAQHDEALHALFAIPPSAPQQVVRHDIARHVLAYQKARQGQGHLLLALAQAQQLSALLEQCDMHGVQLNHQSLASLAPPSMAQHWQDSADFLGIIADYLPHLQAANSITPAAEQRLLAEFLAAHLTCLQPTPVLAFGTTGSVPYVRALLAAVHALPQGHVFLPGLEICPPQPAEPGHAGYFLQHTLAALGLQAQDASPLSATAARPEILACFGQQQVTPTPLMHAIAASHAEEEARLIAALLRETLETPSKTALLITPDIALMRRVAACMQRYGVQVDSPPLQSAGQGLAGSFILQWLEVMANPTDVVAVRQWLEHPAIASGGDEQKDYRQWLLAQDKAAFRATQQLRLQPSHDAPGCALSLMQWLQTLPRRQNRATLAQYGAWLREVASLCAVPEEVTEAIAEHCRAVEEISDIYGPLEADEVLALWQEHLASPGNDEAGSPHPRLRMLTPVEARMMHADRVILGAMHDAQWGAAPASHWLNQRQLAALGLPTLAAQQSLTAHDVWMHVHAPEVFLTLAKRDGGQPTTPHHYWHRLEPLFYPQAQAEHWLALARAHHVPPAYDFMQPPAPQPPTAARPKSLRVRALDALFVNPYHIYAEYVLCLRPLDAYGPPNDRAVLGTAAHAMIADIWQHGTLAADYLPNLLKRLQLPKDKQRFWQWQLQTIADFAQKHREETLARGETVQCETPLEVQLQLAEGMVGLRGRIDAVYAGAEAYGLVDYKTGSAPTRKNIEQGLACQLTAYGIMRHAQTGAWPEYIDYLELPTVRRSATHTRIAWGAEEWEMHAAGLAGALAQLQNENLPLLAHPLDVQGFESRHTDYDGISRVEEWG